jgi:MarR family transcriptional regulator for hemolysin
MEKNLEKLLFQVTASMAPGTRQWQRLVHARLERYGVSSGCIGPLILIGRADGGLSQVQLAQELGMESPSLVRLLDKLTAADLIRRECDASDRRSNRLSLTEKGWSIYPEMERELTTLRNQVFAGMSATEVQAVLKLYRLLAQAV